MFSIFACLYQEEALAKEQLEGDEEKQMQEYRAQLDAERASKLARGKNHAGPTSKSKDKDKKRRHSISHSRL